MEAHDWERMSRRIEKVRRNRDAAAGWCRRKDGTIEVFHPKNSMVRQMVESHHGAGSEERIIRPGWWHQAKGVIRVPEGVSEAGGVVQMFTSAPDSYIGRDYKWWWLEVRWVQPLSQRQMRHVLSELRHADDSIRGDDVLLVSQWGDKWPDPVALNGVDGLRRRLAGLPLMRLRWGGHGQACRESYCSRYRQGCDVHEVHPGHLDNPQHSPIDLPSNPWYEV